MTTTLMTPEALQAMLANSATHLVVVDCTFDLADPAAGRAIHHAGHIPGAYYLHLDNELSGAKNGANGRHPLPEREDFVARLRMLGVNDDTQVVAYDANGGVFAARLWWMLRWIGHPGAAVLDGGRQAWKAAGYPLEPGVPDEPALPEERGNLTLRPSLVPVVETADVHSNLHNQTRLVVDARTEDRFRGENETLDPVGGHIPGARNHCFKQNLDGVRFKPADLLRSEWLATLGAHTPEDSIMQCGSGVTACHNLLALEVAGLSGAALYPGSWSEWCLDPARPMARGE
jgi:thiosulfate/3-mercaptopyruvate sulfurtransferase